MALLGKSDFFLHFDLNHFPVVNNDGELAEFQRGKLLRNFFDNARGKLVFHRCVGGNKNETKSQVNRNFLFLLKKTCSCSAKMVSLLNFQLIAGWSSSVARQAHNLKVLGSNPNPAPNFKSPRSRLNTSLAGFLCAFAARAFSL